MLQWHPCLWDGTPQYQVHMPTPTLPKQSCQSTAQNLGKHWNNRQVLLCLQGQSTQQKLCFPLHLMWVMAAAAMPWLEVPRLTTRLSWRHHVYYVAVTSTTTRYLWGKCTPCTVSSRWVKPTFKACSWCRSWCRQVAISEPQRKERAARGITVHRWQAHEVRLHEDEGAQQLCWHAGCTQLGQQVIQHTVWY